MYIFFKITTKIIILKLKLTSSMPAHWRINSKFSNYPPRVDVEPCFHPSQLMSSPRVSKHHLFSSFRPVRTSPLSLSPPEKDHATLASSTTIISLSLAYFSTSKQSPIIHMLNKRTGNPIKSRPSNSPSPSPALLPWEIVIYDRRQRFKQV